MLRLIKEALLKTTLLMGFPKTLNAFYPLATYIASFPATLVPKNDVVGKNDSSLGVERDGDRDTCRDARDGEGKKLTEEELFKRGIEYFKVIYGDDVFVLLQPVKTMSPGLCKSQLPLISHHPSLNPYTKPSPFSPN